MTTGNETSNRDEKRYLKIQRRNDDEEMDTL